MKKTAAVVLCLALLFSQFALAQTQDVPSGHWAYQAVKDLANKGMVVGYPDGNFLGNRTITRYEMATIIARVLSYVEQQKANTSAQSAATTTPAASPAPPPVSPEDLATVKKLVEEYKVELTVIGTDLKKVQEDLENVKADVQQVKDVINEPEGQIQTTISDVAKLKKIKVSGYVQARYENYQNPIGVNNIGDNRTLDNRFYLRRARFKITGEPTPNTVGVVQLDVAGYDRSNVASKDVYLEYHPWGNGQGPLFTRFGQMNWPFGYIIEWSSSARPTPERPKAWAGTSVVLPNYPRFSGLFPGERDRGLALYSSSVSKSDWAIGVFNGQGTTTPYLTSGGRFEDNNADKAVVGRFRYPVLENLLIGASGYYGHQAVLLTGATAATNVLQTRYGGDVQFYARNFSLKGEYMTGKEPFLPNAFPAATPATLGTNRTVTGWYLLGTYNVTRKDQLVAMYDVLDDQAFSTTFGTLPTWNLGVVHYLDDATKVKAFYEINKEDGPTQVKNNGFRFEVLTVF